MPGWSLWLIPPPSNSLNAILLDSISSTYKHFQSPHLFSPHVTLTSEISESDCGSDPQKWLDNLLLSFNQQTHVTFGKLNSEDKFFKKLYIEVEKEGVKDLAIACRRGVRGYEDPEAATAWVEEKFGPHLSLLYSDGNVSEQDIAEVECMLGEHEVRLNGKGGERGGWAGGMAVLVPTNREIKDWQVLATKVLDI